MERFKRSVVFRSVSVILIAAFLVYDIAWAHPVDSHMRRDLQVESPFQDNMMSEIGAERQRELFAGVNFTRSVLSIARYLLGDDEQGLKPQELGTLQTVLGAELGDSARGIDLSEVQFKDGVVTIFYQAGDDELVINVARRSDVPDGELSGYDWKVTDDQYLIKVSRAVKEGDLEEAEAVSGEEIDGFSVDIPAEEKEYTTRYVPRGRITFAKVFLFMLILGVMQFLNIPVGMTGELMAQEPVQAQRDRTQKLNNLLKREQNATDFFDRQQAIWLLGSLGDERAIPTLVRLLKEDEDWRVRFDAAGSLGKIGGESVEKYLVDALRNDNHHRVREKAAFALYRSGSSPATVDLLLEKVYDEKEARYVRRYSSYALSTVRGDKARSIEEMTKILADPKLEFMSLHTVMGLMEMKDRRTIPVLIDQVNRWSGETGRHIVEALAEFKCEEAVGPIRRKFRDNMVKDTAIEALFKIGGEDATRVLLYYYFEDSRYRSRSFFDGNVNVTQVFWDDFSERLGRENVKKAIAVLLEDRSVSFRTKDKIILALRFGVPEAQDYMLNLLLSDIPDRKFKLWVAMRFPAYGSDKFVEPFFEMIEGSDDEEMYGYLCDALLTHAHYEKDKELLLRVRDTGKYLSARNMVFAIVPAFIASDEGREMLAEYIRDSRHWRGENDFHYQKVVDAFTEHAHFRDIPVLREAAARGDLREEDVEAIESALMSRTDRQGIKKVLTEAREKGDKEEEKLLRDTIERLAPRVYDEWSFSLPFKKAFRWIVIFIGLLMIKNNAFEQLENKKEKAIYIGAMSLLGSVGVFIVAGVMFLLTKYVFTAAPLWLMWAYGFGISWFLLRIESEFVVTFFKPRDKKLEELQQRRLKKEKRPRQSDRRELPKLPEAVLEYEKIINNDRSRIIGAAQLLTNCIHNARSRDLYYALPEHRTVKREYSYTYELKEHIYEGLGAVDVFLERCRSEVGDDEKIDGIGRSPNDLRRMKEEVLKGFERMEPDSLLSHLIIQARLAKMSNKSLIIGIETDWIPGMDKGSIQHNLINPLLAEIGTLNEKLKERGFDNVVVVHKGKDEILDDMAREIGDEPKVLSNVVLFGSNTIVEKFIDKYDVRNKYNRNTIAPLLGAVDPRLLVQHYQESRDMAQDPFRAQILEMLLATFEAGCHGDYRHDLNNMPFVDRYELGGQIIHFLPKPEVLTRNEVELYRARLRYLKSL